MKLKVEEYNTQFSFSSEHKEYLLDFSDPKLTIDEIADVSSDIAEHIISSFIEKLISLEEDQTVANIKREIRRMIIESLKQHEIWDEQPRLAGFLFSSIEDPVLDKIRKTIISYNNS